MDMHGIIFDVDDTRDDMAQPFSEHIKSSMESGTHFEPPMFASQWFLRALRCIQKSSIRRLWCALENKYLLFRWKIDRIHIVVGMWHSLVARIVRDDEAAGSNPVIPTIYSTCKDQPMGGSFSVYGEAREISEPCFPHMNVRYV